jgi:hypothetical protein
MNDLDIRPTPGQALGDETPMAMHWCGLAAEQTTDAFREQVPIEGIRDTSCVHQHFEARDIPFPVMVLAIGITNLTRGCQLREMDVASAVETIQEPGKVVLFREPGQLSAGFEADIDDLFDAMV